MVNREEKGKRVFFFFSDTGSLGVFHRAGALVGENSQVPPLSRKLPTPRLASPHFFSVCADTRSL